MAQESIQSSAELGDLIKNRRKELSLTIEAAAKKSGVGTKTWSRYEAGAPIRTDKVVGVCKVLKWSSLPTTNVASEDEEDDEDEDFDDDNINIDKFVNYDAWSTFLLNNFGKTAAISFAVGSDMLLDDILLDLEELQKMPKDSHIGEIENSSLIDFMPPQFVTHYNYELLYHLSRELMHLRDIASNHGQIVAHNAAQELLIYMVAEESAVYFECMDIEMSSNELVTWAFELFDDDDIVVMLYNDFWIDEDNDYHISNWFEDRFYI